MSLGTINSNKDSAQTFPPLWLVVFTFQQTTTLSPTTYKVATVPVTVPGGVGSAPSGFYDGRIKSMNVEALQHRSQQGVDRPAKVTIQLRDSDRFIWNNLIQQTNGTPQWGFRGATVQFFQIMWQPGTSNFTTDTITVFQGSCDQQVVLQGGNILSIVANTGHDMSTVKLPNVVIGNRCPKIFPRNAAERLIALTDPSNPLYQCGYSAGISGGCGNTSTPNVADAYGNIITDGSGIYIACDYLKSDPSRGNQTVGCMARLGNYATTSVSADGDIWHDQSGNVTGRFGGNQWSPGTYYAIAKNYTNNTKVPTFSFFNAAVLGQYHNLGYGTQFVVPKLANIIESGNDTKVKAMICWGKITNSAFDSTGVIMVIANGIVIPRAGTPPTDPNLWWDYVSYGDRGGNPGGANNDTGYSNHTYSALDDPYGSIATIEIVMYQSIFTGFGTPSIQILTQLPQPWCYAPIATAVGNGTTLSITFPAGVPNAYIAIPASGGVFRVFGNSASAVNALYTTMSGSGFGPPGTVSMPSSFSGTGTGGYVGCQSAGASNNPIWQALDILQKGNWALTEINLSSFITAAYYCDAVIGYLNSSGKYATHARFRSSFVLESRRTAAEVFAALLRNCLGYSYYDNAGLLNVGIEQTLYDQQGTLPSGSNYSTPVNSFPASFKEGWIASFTYTTGDVVTYLGSWYMSTASSNIGVTPPSSPWTAISQPVGYLAYLFNESNIMRVGSGDDERFDIQTEQQSTLMTPNQLFIQFQDEENQYAVDSLGLIDPDAVARAGGALQPGGSVVPETLQILGTPNMDQASRITNVTIAEMQYGNLANDPRGTDTWTIGVTIEAVSLRNGQIIGISLPTFGYSLTMFRVVKVQTTADYEQARLTVKFHNDLWYTDIYAQAPQQFYSTAGTQRRARAPLPWQPNGEQPSAPAADAYPQITTTEWNFIIQETDAQQDNGNLLVTYSISGMPPLNLPPAATQPPLVPIQATVGTGGSLNGPLHLHIQICALDPGGLYSAPSGDIIAFIPSGVTGASVTVSGLQWYPNTSTWDLFAGRDHLSITHQLSGSGNPSSITLNALTNNLAYAPPDLTANSVYAQGKIVIHGGIIGEGVIGFTTTTITIAASVAPLTNTLTGYKIMKIGSNTQGGSGATIPINIFTITGQTVNGDNTVTFTVDRNPTGLIAAGDVIVINTNANIHTATTIGDTNFNNSYGPGGVTGADIGMRVRIVAGKGRYQTRIITAVSGGTAYTISPAWSTEPDATSWFIVEEPNWRFNSDTLPLDITGYQSQPVCTLDFSNFSEITVLVQVLVIDPSDNLVSVEQRSPFRMVWLQGVQGTETFTS